MPTNNKLIKNVINQQNKANSPCHRSYKLNLKKKLIGESITTISMFL